MFHFIFHKREKVKAAKQGMCVDPAMLVIQHKTVIGGSDRPSNVFLQLDTKKQGRSSSVIQLDKTRNGARSSNFIHRA